MKNIIKSHLLIENKLLGALLYFKDKKGRGCLKLSFKNKIANFVKYSDVPTIMPTPLELKNAISFDISYKFVDNLLELKKVINGKTVREFYSIFIPISTSLFIVKIKNWHLLDDAESYENSLVIPYNGQGNDVAIIFSFLGVDGKPIAPKEYSMLMGIVDLPERDLNKFCIGIAEDKNNNYEKNFIIEIPYPLKNNK